ncbi:hypothetical protein SANTM175S_08491 [Streptomyces antimycoticus]
MGGVRAGRGALPSSSAAIGAGRADSIAHPTAEQYSGTSPPAAGAMWYADDGSECVTCTATAPSRTEKWARWPVRCRRSSRTGRASRSSRLDAIVVAASPSRRGPAW